MKLFMYPETAAGTAGAKVSNKTRHGKDATTETVSFAADTASKTGKTERAIRNHAKIGKELSGVAEQLRDTPKLELPR